jgi:hypothetical protein
MENIVKLRQNIPLRLILLVILSFFSCKSVPGPIYPTYKNQGFLNQIFPNTNKNQIVFYFDIYTQIYQENLMGELILEEKTYFEKFENKNIKVSHLNFQLRTLSKNRNKDIRLREYKGIVYFDEPYLDLHAQDCYTFAKKTYYDRFYPIEGWDCDHLIFLLKKENNALRFIQKNSPDYEKLEKNQKERLNYTFWFSSDELQIPNLFVDQPWYGKLIDETQEHYVFYGKDANRFLKKGDFASLYPNNHQVKVAESIGDFLFIDKSYPLDINQKNIFIYLPKKTK